MMNRRVFAFNQQIFRRSFSQIGHQGKPQPKFEVLEMPAPGNPFHLAIPVHNMKQGEFLL